MTPDKNAELLQSSTVQVQRSKWRGLCAVFRAASCVGGAEERLLCATQSVQAAVSLSNPQGSLASHTLRMREEGSGHTATIELSPQQTETRCDQSDPRSL